MRTPLVPRASDRLSRRIDPLGKSEIFSYDGNGNLVSTTDRKNQTSIFAYDPLNRRSQASYADGAVATFIYDAGSRLTPRTASSPSVLRP